MFIQLEIIAIFIYEPIRSKTLPSLLKSKLEDSFIGMSLEFIAKFYESLISSLFFLIYQCLISKLTGQIQFQYLTFRLSINIFIEWVTMFLFLIFLVQSQSLSEISCQCLTNCHCSHFLEFISQPFLYDHILFVLLGFSSFFPLQMA